MRYVNRRLELQIILYVGGWNHISAPLHDATVVEWRGRVNLFNGVHIVERVAVWTRVVNACPVEYGKLTISRYPDGEIPMSNNNLNNTHTLQIFVSSNKRDTCSPEI